MGSPLICVQDKWSGPENTPVLVQGPSYSLSHAQSLSWTLGAGQPSVSL